MASFNEMAPVIVPLLILQVGLLAFGLWDLTRPGRRVRGGQKVLWGLVIVFIGIIGPLLYFLLGREDS